MHKVISSTMGVSSPDPEDQGRWYRWNGDPAKSLAAEKAAARPQGTKTSEDRATRLARYFAARDDGQDKPAAADTAGVTPSTGRDYEREYRDHLAAREAKR